MRLLLVEDEKFIAEPLVKALEKEGFAVDYADNGKTGLNKAQINEYDCIILDLNLPEMDGLEVSKTLRSTPDFATPILMLTARSSQFNKIEGFEAGTDDYLTKPFNYKELLLRVRALIRRNSKIQTNVVEVAGLRVFLDEKRATLHKKEVSLSNKEYALLEYLIRNKGKIISQEELLEHVWDDSVDIFSQTVKATINHLRKKIDPKKKIIETVKGMGYRIS